MTAPLPFDPSRSIFAVGWPAIDLLHEECERLVALLVEADASSYLDLLSRVIEHLHEHFGAEEALMLASRYPRYDEHKREHDAVVQVVRRVREQCAVREFGGVDRLRDEFPLWFQVHAGSMDTQLAAWLREQPPPPPPPPA